MDTPRARRLSLTLKVNIILVAALAVGVGVVMALYTLSLISTRDLSSRRNLVQEGDILYTSIANFMLPGQAPLAVKYIGDVSQRFPDLRVALFRRDGKRAFSDNATIERVNANLKKDSFKKRPQDPPPEPAFAMPRFQEASQVPPADVFFREAQGGRSYFRIYRPLINLPKCSVCHGPDHTVRGVLDIRSDVTSLDAAQLSTIAEAGLGFLLVVGLLATVIGTFLRRVVLRPVGAIGQVCAAVAAGDFGGRVQVGSRDEIGDLARTVNGMVQGLYERFELTKYVSAGTIGAIQGDQAPKRVSRTLLFTDVRGFTAYTGSRDPERVVSVLNRLLERQSEIIHAAGGDIDKFVGDEIVAAFPEGDGAARACRAALAIVRLCASSDEFDGLAVGAGIATGTVIQGMVGGRRRADFTVIGDTVNIASRLCGVAKAGQIIVDAGTREAAAASYEFMGPYGAALKGKEGKQRVWILRGELP